MRKVAGGSWIQVDGELILRDTHKPPIPNAPFVQGDISDFKSPIDGQQITDRAQLRQHMTDHGVTDARDYSDEWYEKKGRARDGVLRSDTHEAKQERIETIKAAIERHT